MHEWAVARAIVAVVSRIASGRIRKVVISVPVISFLDEDVLKEAYSRAVEGTPLEDSELEVKTKEVRFTCLNCGREFTSRDVVDQVEALREEFGEEYPLHMFPSLAPALISCPYCGSHDLEVRGGEIRLEGVEVESDKGRAFRKVSSLLVGEEGV